MSPSACTISSLYIDAWLRPHIVSKTPKSFLFEENIFSCRFLKCWFLLSWMLELDKFNFFRTQLFIRRDSGWSNNSSILTKDKAFHRIYGAIVLWHLKEISSTMPSHFSIMLGFAQNLLEHILFFDFLLFINFSNI